MKIRFLKLKNWLLVTVMGALGLSACHCHKKTAATEVETDTIEMRDRGEVRLMYGVPTMDFEIRGRVVNPKGKPVRGVQINMLERNMEMQGTELQGDPERVKEFLESNAVSTDENGKFIIKSNGLPQEQVRLLVRDVDGTKNGNYQNQLKELEVTPDDMDRTNADGWYQGTFNKEVEIQLESK